MTLLYGVLSACAGYCMASHWHGWAALYAVLLILVGNRLEKNGAERVKQGKGGTA